jgi:dienelactone hydrolase
MPTVATRETLEQRISALTPGIDVLLPEGEGPFPVAIQMHGCGGKKKLQGRWAAVARAAGWAVVVVDSYAHRGISQLAAYATVCTGLQLWGRERAGDLYAMLEWARAQEWADSKRIVVAGWSHGAWTTLDAMAMQPGETMAKAARLNGIPDDPFTGLVGVFLLYPWQGVGAIAPREGLRVDVPIRAIVGTKDTVVGGRGVIRTLSNMKTPSRSIDVEVFEGATHAFDELEAQDWRNHYDPVLTERAHGIYAAFLSSLA